jgi:competence protein ComEC
MLDRIFYSISFGYILGVFLGSHLEVGFYSTLLLFFLAGISILFFSTISRNKWGMIASFFILFIAFGIFYFNYFNDKPAPIFLERQVESDVSLTGVIVDDIEERETNQRLVVKVVENQEKAKVLVSIDLGQDFSYGDEVSFTGKLEKPENFTTDNGKEFDYINYLKKDGILYLVKNAHINKVSENKGNFLKNYLFKIKNAFVEKINLSIPPYESTLLNGLILGERSSFPDSLREDFIKTGTIHIVALSGYNVTIIAEWFMKILYFLPQVLAIYGGIIAIILFVLMTGGASTSIRAGTMAILTLIARATGRNYDVARGLIFAGVFMILLNPYVLYYDVSFQLSFVATIAVIFFTPKVEPYFLWVPERFGLRDVVTVTTAAYLFVLPFILYKMGNLSIVALPTNILVLPLIPITMLFGFLTGFLSFFSSILALPFSYLAYYLLHYELYIIQLFALFPFASFNIQNFPLILTILIYLYFIKLIFGKSISKFFKEDIS